MKNALKLAIALAGSFFLTLDNEGREAIARVLGDPLSLFAARSPGARQPGALTQSKLARPKVPVSKKLAEGVELLPPAKPPIFGEFPADEQAEAPASGEPLALLDTSALPHSPPTFSGPIPVNTPGHGGGGRTTPQGPGGVTPPSTLPPGNPPPNRPPDNPPPPVPEIPEPASWILIISGFFMLGSAFRRRNRLRGRPVWPQRTGG